MSIQDLETEIKVLFLGRWCFIRVKVPWTKMHGRLLKVCALLIAPVALLLLVASDFGALFLYGVIVIEGLGIAVWAVSRINRDNALAELEAYVHESGRGNLIQQHFYERNRVQALASYIRWARKSGAGDTTYPRQEIARVVRQILLERSSSLPPLDSSSSFSADLDFVLNSYENGEEESGSDKKSLKKLGAFSKRLRGTGIDPFRGRQEDYISRLGRVITFLESSTSH